MNERRSGRAKKTVNYAKLGNSDDNDDDFEEFKTQPKKKAKVELVAKPSKPEKKTIENIKLKSEIPKSRPSIDEKVLQRQINEALKLSEAASTNKTNDGKNIASISKRDCITLISKQNDETKNSSKAATEVENNSEESDFTASSVENESEDEDSMSDSFAEEEATNSEEEMEKKNAHNDLSGKETKPIKKKEVSFITETAKNTNVADVKKDANFEKLKVENLPIVQKKSPAKLTNLPKTNTTPQRHSASRQKMITNGSGAPVLHTSPLKLSPKGIRLGLSRKVPRKPLHFNVKPQV